MEPVEIRLLGALRVRRPDGTYVETSEWRTAMTRGLLALLALSAPHPIPVERALEAIWPNVTPEKSRARLRTAASQIRRAIGIDCIEREGDSLVLSGCWVDLLTFESMVGQARRLFMIGRREEGIQAAYEALGLYAGDVFDDGSGVEWLLPRREHFSRIHRELLIETAEAMLKVGRLRDAVTAAQQVAIANPADEQACRVLMRGHHSLGETEKSFRAYERCRASLAEVLGIDPSAETLQVHRSLLSPRRIRQAPPRFVGREDLLRALVHDVEDAFRTSRPKMITLVGQPGSGKSRLLDELSARLDRHTDLLRMGANSSASADHVIACVRAAARGPRRRTGEANSQTLPRAAVLCLDDFQWVEQESQARIAESIADVATPLVIIAATTEAPTGSAYQGGLYRLRSLSRNDTSALLRNVLDASVAESTVDAFIDDTRGLPGPLLEQTALLRDAGLLHESPDGLVRGSLDLTFDTRQRPIAQLESIRATLPPGALAVLDVLAVLGEPVTARTLDRLEVLAAPSEPDLDLLYDLGLLARQRDDYEFATQQLCDAARNWLRAAVRRRLHRKLATGSPDILSHETRLRQWVAAGRPQTGSADPVDSILLAVAAHSPIQLRVPFKALDGVESVDDRLDVLVAIMSTASRRADETTAVRASNLSIALASASRPERLPELYRRRGLLMPLGEDSVSWCKKARELVRPTNAIERSHIEGASGRLLSRWSHPLALQASGLAVRLADVTDDVRRQVRSRAYLVDELISGCRLERASEISVHAADLADDAGNDVLRAIGLHSIAQTSLRTGSSSQCVRTLERAWPLSRADQNVHGVVACDLAVAQHVFGSGSVDDALELARQVCEGTNLEPMWHLAAAWVSLDRGAHEACATHLSRTMAVGNWSVSRYARALLINGSLFARTHDPEQAARAFSWAFDVTRHSGATLLMGEAAARLAIVESANDHEAAEKRLGRTTRKLGAGRFKREQTLFLLARAHVAQGRGQLEVAQILAQTAKCLAVKANLTWLESECQVMVERCGGDAEPPLDARTRTRNLRSSDAVV